MTPDDHRRAGELFNLLREVPESERDAALESACPEDSVVRAQVIRLLEADRGAGSFLGGRAIEDAARLIGPDAFRLPAEGTVIGKYRLGPRIGAGGMGVVFEGYDLQLKRRVAIEILPPPFAGEAAEQVKRFQRESRAASLLNHPNIVSIYYADFDQGYYYIATEFIEGRTLRQLIEAAPAGIDRQTMLRLVVQTASALSAAHAGGIIHRDIKPENIMLRPDGFVKVLDFGLAKLRELDRHAAGEMSDLRTRPGHLAGTIQYLSPEQVAGRPVDARSDLFSLGVVTYELATGIRPFDGPTDGAVYDAILHRSPTPPSSLRAALGKECDALILRALEKDPALRFASADELRSSFEGLSHNSGHPAALPRHVRRMSLGFWVLAGLACAGLAGAALWWTIPGRSPAGSRAPLPVQFVQLTDLPGEESHPSLSSDGKQFVYASAAQGNWDIYLQRTGGSTFVDLTQDCRDDDTEPAFSPDAGRIAFRSEREGGGLFVMEATGENPRRISTHGYFPAWSPDGKSIVYSDLNFISPSSRQAPVSRLHVIDLATGAERKLETEDAVQPSWSPHGYRIAYWGIGVSDHLRDIFTVGANGGSAVAVTSDPAVDWNPVWSASGDALYFISDRGGSMNLWRVPIDERSGRVRGDPEPVTVPASSVAYLSFSADGRSFAYSEARQRNNLFSIGYDPVRQTVTGEPEPVGNSAHNVSVFSLSPDDSQLVHDAVGEAQEDLWIMNRDGTGRRRLTNDPFKDRSPAWSPLGDKIVFMSDRSGRYDEWSIRPDGGELRRLTNSTLLAQRPVWTADGKMVVASRLLTSPMLVDALAAAPVPDQPPLKGLEAYPGALFSPFPSRGSLLTAEWNTEKGWELLFYDISTGRAELPGIPGRRPAWMPQGRQILFGRGSQGMLYDLDTKRERELFSVAPNILYEIHPLHDGRRIYFTQTIRDGDLWLARMPK